MTSVIMEAGQISNTNYPRLGLRRQSSVLSTGQTAESASPKRNDLKRQSSGQSSRSTKSSGSLTHLQKKVQEHFFTKQTSEWQKQEEYRCRRNRRKIKERQDRKISRLRLVRRFYVPAVILIGFGTCILLGSTVPSIGHGSPFWTHRSVFSIVGVSVLVVGIIVLMIVVGFDSKISEGLDKVEYEPFIHPDFKRTRPLLRQDSQETALTTSMSIGRGRSIYSLEDSQTRNFFNQTSDLAKDNMCSNVDRQKVKSNLNFVDIWANAMKLNLNVTEIVSNDSDTPKLDISTSSSDQTTCNGTIQKYDSERGCPSNGHCNEVENTINISDKCYTICEINDISDS